MDDIQLLQAKFEDLLERSEKFGCACTRFLSPKESFFLLKYIKFHHPDIKFLVDGGYPDAERKLIFVLSDFFDESFIFKEDHYRLMRIEGSGYYDNSHKDYLGALLGLGLEREMIGDICIDGNSAYVFVLPKICEFLLSVPCPLVTVGRDKVKVSSVSFDVANAFKRDYEKIPTLVSSLRLDCVVCALTGLSREKCDKAIASGLVTHNYEIASRSHVQVKDGDIISVRGHGKFLINVTDQTTKKGKIKINAMKYI